jgi:hypothetical protein
MERSEYPSRDIIPLRSNEHYPLYQDAALRWATWSGQQAHAMSRAKFNEWLLCVNDDTLDREMRKWCLPPERWTAVDLEAEGIELAA